ncbi:MAG TPA: serine--tRNA ligase [Polyangia bacterium]|jgi:seryl-tRNA synthetase|nr:serine--tRNA ligase [Polyangia bacterium]
MIDLKLLREQPEDVIAIYRDRLFDDDAAKIARKLIDLDTRRRQIVATSDELKQRRNLGSAAVGREKDPDKRKQLIADMEGMKGQIAQADHAIAALDEELQTLALQLPNLPDPSVPAGRSDADNKVLREVGDKRAFAFAPKPHWDLGTELGIIDFERGVKISGTRFYLLRGVGARLQRALITWMIDVHNEQGYAEVYPPQMVKRECLVGTGNLPKFGENLYRDAEEDFYWVPTAEVPVTNMYRDEVLDADALPLKHVAYTACFRREKMAHGKDTRGIKRGHQFDKVEMVKFVAPETSLQELDKLVDDAAEILRRLELPYRVVEMVTGDLSFAACKKYDLEAWAPGCNEWLEVSSCSSFGDFQARRAMIRAKSGKDKPRYVHTLNGSGLALPRTLIAVLENYQRADGSVEVPKVLRPYLGGLDTITAATK